MQVVHKDPFAVVGILVEGTWDELPTKMRAAWQTFFDRVSAIPHQFGEYALDISVSEDNGVYTQLICKEVSRVEEVPSGMVAREIPAGQYVYYRHQGDVTQIAESFGKMYEWVAAEGYMALDFKIDNGYTTQGDEMKHDLYLAIHNPGLETWD